MTAKTTTKNKQTESILAVVRDCDAALVTTVRPDGWPETRHLANMMNKAATDLTLYFMTGRHSPKVEQITANPKCSLYYYNDADHHSVRLFGTMKLIDDEKTRRAHWDDAFLKFGYSGVDDPEFVLLRFTPSEYKYYDADGLQSGKIK